MKIFLSSPWRDLEIYREQAMHAIKRFGHCAVGMEFMGASEKRTIDMCLGELRDCDLMVCVLGATYGTRPNGDRRSFTHMEIDYAIERKIPIVPFFRSEAVPILPKLRLSDDDERALTNLKNQLSDAYTPSMFTNPEDLRARIGEYLSRRDNELIPEQYREAAYDSIAPWYDRWYVDHWNHTQPFNAICRIAERHWTESNKGNISKIRILDCACGTGNAYGAFRRQKFDIWGTDGSKQMLAHAFNNCAAHNIPTDQLVRDPINWTDGNGYQRHFEPESFDLIINTANSFCHLPPIKGYMDKALDNFRNLLKPGGLLFIDTKRYVQEGSIREVPIYKELIYREAPVEWAIRTDRPDVRDVPTLGRVHFHTRLHYDIDPSFDVPVQRALIVLTIYGEKLAPQTLLIPYYPLPRKRLEKFMEKAEFTIRSYDAFSREVDGWKYDAVVGVKPPV